MAIPLNLQTASPDLTKTFEIAAPPGADVWRGPPKHIISDAPMIVRQVQAGEFTSIRATISLEPKQLYDQAGIIILFDCPRSDGSMQNWLKAGVELYEKPCFSCVVTREWSDWSLSPFTPKVGNGRLEFTILIEREKLAGGKPGPLIWMYRVYENGEKQPLRQVTAAFLDRKPEDTILVGCYAARPENDLKENLVASFSHFSVT